MNYWFEEQFWCKDPELRAHSASCPRARMQTDREDGQDTRRAVVFEQRVGLCGRKMP